jgi:hypothetical protein
MPSLGEIFALREATPFSPQAGSQASLSVNRNASVGMDDTPMKKTLGQVEDLLRRVMTTEDNQALNRVINKFLVDITPYLDQP